MSIYRLLGESDLIALAERRGWVVDPPEGAAHREILAPVRAASNGKTQHLPEVAVDTSPSRQLRIPRARIHGGNFSLVVDDMIFPGGFVHSFWPSPAWKAAGKGEVVFRAGAVQRVEAKDPALLGLLSHWGHFFVDALDRLLHLERLGRLAGPLLVADPDFFRLHPKVDGCHAVPQVSELVGLLGIALSPSQMTPILRVCDYDVEDLTVCTLRSIKPAISADSYRAVRRRVFERLRFPAGPASNTLFVGRADIKKRFILDQPVLIDYWARVHGVETVFPENMTATQAVGRFSAASRVVLPIGSAKFNLLFCRPGTQVVCITPRGYAAVNGGVVLMVRHLCQALGLSLAFYDVDIVEKPILLNSDLIVTEDDVDNIVELFDAML